MFYSFVCFLRSLFFTFLASLMAFSVPWKCRDCKSAGISSLHSSLWLPCFLVRCPKRSGTGIEISIQSWRFLLHMDNHFSCTVRISTNETNSILVHFVDWLFHALQTLFNRWLSNYHISMISSNILHLGSFFSQHRPFDTLWFQLHHTLTP